MPDLVAENTKNVPELLSLQHELQEVLSSKDKRLLRILQLSYDNKNLLAYLANKEAELSALGSLSRDDLESLVELMQEVDNPQDKRLPVYFLPFYRTITDEKLSEQIGLKSDYLSSLYYDYARKSDNDFIAGWFTYCLNINNILTAYYCRKYNMDNKHSVVGSNDVAKTLRSSNARDFGLTGVVDKLETILAIAEEPNLLERERRIDALKWAWLDEHTFCHYFAIERVLSFCIRCELLLRWKGLTKEHGKEVFEKVGKEMKKQIEV